MVGVGTPLLVVACLGGGMVVLSVGTFLFQAGSALADVPGRSYFRSLGINFVAVLVCLPLAAILIWFGGAYDVDPNGWFGGVRIAAMLVSLLLTWVLSAVIYAFILAASVQKGLIIAGVELLLMGLLSALVAAIVLVVLAFVQIISRPPPAHSRLALSPVVRVAESVALP